MKPTTEKIRAKKYRCDKCGHEKMIETNHYGECYSLGRYNACPNCPPSAKYPEYGSSTTWKCCETLPEHMTTPEPWKTVRLGDIAKVD